MPDRSGPAAPTAAPAAPPEPSALPDPRRATTRQALIEPMLDAALAALRQGALPELLRQHPGAARWLMRRFVGLVRGSAGDAFDGEPADAAVAALLLRWGLAQLRPDGQPADAAIPPAAWLQQPGWRPMLAAACHAGLLAVPDFPARYRRHPGEPALENLCGLWEVAPSTFYRYLDRARQGLADGHLGRLLRDTARATVIHPVVLPIIAGLLVNASGIGVPSLIDELLVQLGQAVVPLCLVLLGVSLNQYGFVFTGRGMAALVMVKLMVMPAVVLVVGHWVFGLEALPLTVVVMAAALPSGSNPLLFAQRYQVLEAETTSAIAVSTLGFMLTAPLWLALVARVVGA